MTKQKQSEFEHFDSTMRMLMKVPHSEIKAKLEEEKKAKKASTPKRKSDDERNKERH